MNLLNTILNGLLFANVNNLGEFRTLLRQVAPSSASERDHDRHGLDAVPHDTSNARPEFRHAHGAL
ncbi:MAG: hypothetical protein ACYC0P_10305 [Thiobacillus sp.]